MSKCAVPFVVEQYVFVQLLGKEAYGRIDDDDDSPHQRVRTFLAARLPDKGLFDRRREALEAGADAAEYISELIFDCPNCGDGPHCHPEDRPILEYLREELHRADKEARGYDREIALLDRLKDPDLMGEAYEALSELRTDEDWIAFIEAARAAEQNYGEYRRIQKDAARLLSDISKGARQLARQMTELQRTGISLPPELRQHAKDAGVMFFSSESHEQKQLMLRRYLESVLKPPSDRQAEGGQDLKRALHSVADLTQTMDVDFESPEIEAALVTRQDSKKSAYFRAFATLLEQSQIKLTPAMKRAMAVTANVVFNDPDLAITEDTVRKALKATRQKARKASQPKPKPPARKTRAFDEP